MKTSVIGYPRVGVLRDLKFATEKYFKNILTKEDLQSVAADLKKTHWHRQKEAGIDFVASNDFSFYDQVLDTAVLLDMVPERYKRLGLDALDTYFAMARGYQGKAGDVKALSMKKWFNTNYHYMVPEIEDACEISLVGEKPFEEYVEAKSLGVDTKPVIVGAYTLLKLAKFTGKKKIESVLSEITSAYSMIIQRFCEMGANWIQFDEPALTIDMSNCDVKLFKKIYSTLLGCKRRTKILLQTYFGDIRDCYQEVLSLDFDGIGLDFVEGNQTLELISKNGFPANKTLFAGVVSGKNIWKNNYNNTINIINEISQHCANIVLNTSCSLLHVPYTLKNETQLPAAYRAHFAFAEEKLVELADLKKLLSALDPKVEDVYEENQKLFSHLRTPVDIAVQKKVSELRRCDFVRCPNFGEREKIQKEVFAFPLLPTTTIGSFPQTSDVKRNRSDYRKGKITFEQYKNFNKNKIAECIALQEKIGLDLLVHGEFERNDMVEFFGANLEGFLFTEKAWVQSYGTRCVKPPIIWGDVSRSQAMTVDETVFAQSIASKHVKGMLTGPVTILNWSFPREDIPLNECAFQIALAIREEALELEANGIQIIQIDEAALREKLPLRKSDWHRGYLDWAIPAFRLVHSGVKPETQIHTHMCYSEFSDIIKDIESMDADVITFEAARSDLSIVNTIQESGFVTQVGPGVYDIHSPRIPRVAEITSALAKILKQIPKEKLWVNPDCGLKTRGNEETLPSLENMVAAAKEMRKSI